MWWIFITFLLKGNYMKKEIVISENETRNHFSEIATKYISA